MAQREIGLAAGEPPLRVVRALRFLYAAQVVGATRAQAKVVRSLQYIPFWWRATT